MTQKNLNKMILLSFSLMVGAVHMGTLHAEPLSLKSSLKLDHSAAKQGVVITPTTTLIASPVMKPGNTSTQLLGKVNLFRGVLVDDGVVSKPNLSQFKTELNGTGSKTQSAIKAVYGGLQVSLKENLSLVYTPGKLSSTTLNSESQGLYLLTRQDGLANWFLGVESNSYSTTNDARRTSNTAQFGVIVNLN